VADLSINFAGIKSPNPFWLASAPPTNSGSQIHRAFEAGWGGAVWKTIGAPVLNISNRYGSLNLGGQKLLAINNIELISDRPQEVNLREIAEVKKAWPDRAVIVSVMVESTRQAWHDIIRRAEDTGADGFELNFGCPHGMSERGMGAAVGQVPEYCGQIVAWVKEAASLPVIVKLTPNVVSVVPPGLAALAAGADGLSLINTLNSVIGLDLKTLEFSPSIGGKGGHGGFAGPAAKPIALHHLSSLMTDDQVRSYGKPVSGQGGISTWQDAAEFLLLGSSSLQVCTAAMHHGYRIIEDLCEGLSGWMDDQGFETVADVTGKTLPKFSDFKDLDLAFRAVARINPSKCIGCNLCYVACNDTAHQCIDLIRPSSGLKVEPKTWSELSNGRAIVADRPRPQVREDDCVGCRLCFNVCPVDECITMESVPSGRTPVTWDQLTKAKPELGEWDAMETYRREVGIEIH
jgi:dihydropyrimidine dehydrogenase (NAD+) subunit PreA